LILTSVKMKKTAFIVSITASVVLALACSVSAQSVTGLLNGVNGKKPANSTDQFGRDTPSGTVLGFLQAAQAENYQSAADFLQMPASRRQSQGADLARKLKALLDTAFVGRVSRISTSPDGNPDNGTSDQQTIGVFSVPNEGSDNDIPVVLVRVTDPSSGKIWLFSSSTLSRVPEVYDTIEEHRVESRLPRSLVANTFLGMPLWQWLALLIALPIAVLIGWAIVLFLAIPRRIYLKLKKRPEILSYRHVSMPMLLVFSAISHRVIAGRLGLPLLSRFYYYRTIGVLVSIGFFWLLLRLTDVIMKRLRLHAVAIGRLGTGTLMLLGQRLLSAFLVILGSLAILSIIGFNLTTVLAGLGIGGIAIAFAAQKTLENLFGGISVLADEVIRVGDYCRFGDKTGTVEDISLRSTRVRTDARTQLSIPNGTLATMSIENYSRRDKILFNPALAIRCDTTGDQLRYILAEIRKLLYQHPRVEPETATVRFANVDPSALRIEIFAYVRTQDSNEFAAIREDLLLRIGEIVSRSGSSFAYPSQTLYLGRDSGLDQEKTAAVEKEVGQWRDQNQLPFPDFTAADKASFRGSIPYPPPESAVAKKG